MAVHDCRVGGPVIDDIQYWQLPPPPNYKILNNTNAKPLYTLILQGILGNQDAIPF